MPNNFNTLPAEITEPTAGASTRASEYCCVKHACCHRYSNNAAAAARFAWAAECGRKLHPLLRYNLFYFCTGIYIPLLYCCVPCVTRGVLLINPFRTAVPFCGETTQISSSLSPKRDCGSKRVERSFGRQSSIMCGRDLPHERHNKSLFRTAVPFGGKPTLIPSNLSPKRDCSTKRVTLLTDIINVWQNHQETLLK